MISGHVVTGCALIQGGSAYILVQIDHDAWQPAWPDSPVGGHPVSDWAQAWAAQKADDTRVDVLAWVGRTDLATDLRNASQAVDDLVAAQRVLTDVAWPIPDDGEMFPDYGAPPTGGVTSELLADLKLREGHARTALEAVQATVSGYMQAAADRVSGGALTDWAADPRPTPDMLRAWAASHGVTTGVAAWVAGISGKPVRTIEGWLSGRYVADPMVRRLAVYYDRGNPPI